jgi:hypothetical protein
MCSRGFKLGNIGHVDGLNGFKANKRSWAFAYSTSSDSCALIALTGFNYHSTGQQTMAGDRSGARRSAIHWAKFRLVANRTLSPKIVI